MIYERINWLNKGETGAKPINKTNLNQMDKGIYDLQNIELIGVEKTAPTECTTGDKYFNTTDKKIYTATADNTWGEPGETPLRGILYVIISSQTSYYYDGDTLISIGGGASGGTSIPVSATPPENPEDGALWIDTDDEGVIVEVDQEVNSGSANAISNKAITNYVNGLNTYSTTETVIGTWVNEDGTKQPLYRKVVYLGNLPNASVKNVPHNISNLKLVTKFYGTYYAPDYSSQAGLPYTVSNANQSYFSYQIAMDINQTNIVLLTSVDRSAYKGQVTIEYTKTTDVPTSEEV